MERTIPGTPFSLEAFQDSGIFYVSINLAGNFWDHREFSSEAEQMAFFSDPFTREREAAKRGEALRRKRAIAEVPYYAWDYVRVSTGRRIAPKGI